MHDQGARDLGYALRRLRRSPLYATVVILTLAAGIGLSASVFSIIDGALLRPLPVRDASRVVTIWPIRPEHPKDQAAYTVADYQAIRKATRSFRTLSFIDLNGAFPRPVGQTDNEQLVRTALVGTQFTQAVGVTPMLGHAFDSAAGGTGAPGAMMISYRYWQREFGGDPAVIGRALSMLGRRGSIAGVLPRGFDYPRGTDVWVVMPDTVSEQLIGLVGTLAPGATAAEARAEIDAVMTGPNSPEPVEWRGTRSQSMSIREAVIGSAGPVMTALSLGVGLLLLMTAVNVAALVLARAAARRAEVSLRMAIGASERDASASLVWECVCLAALGATASIAIAALSLRALLALAPPEMPRLDAVVLDWRGLAYAFAVSAVLATILGAVSAGVARADHSGLRIGRPGTARGTTHWPRRLVVSQVALAVAVMAGAGVTLRSLDALTHVEMGFHPEQLLTGQLFPADGRWPSDSTVWPRTTARVLTALEAVPGISGATLMIAPPFTAHLGWDATYMIEGEPTTALGINPLIAMYTVRPGSFRTLGIPLIAGRDFTSDDRATANVPPAVVSEGLARRLWPGRSALGARIRVGTASDPWCSVVGVVGDSRYRDLEAARPTIFFPDAGSGISALELVVRTRNDPAAMIPTIRHVMATTEPEIGVTALAAMMDVAAPVLASSRFAALLLSFVALAALMLAVAGLYGALAALVESRRRELGIRLALGAVPRALAQVVVRQGAVLTLSGSLIGVLLAFLGTRVLRGLLYGVTPTDPLAFVLVIILMVVVSIIACLVPARRATRVDVLTVMRAE